MRHEMPDEPDGFDPSEPSSGNLDALATRGGHEDRKRPDRQLLLRGKHTPRVVAIGQRQRPAFAESQP